MYILWKSYRGGTPQHKLKIHLSSTTKTFEPVYGEDGILKKLGYKKGYTYCGMNWRYPSVSSSSGYYAWEQIPREHKDNLICETCLKALTKANRKVAQAKLKKQREIEEATILGENFTPLSRRDLVHNMDGCQSLV